MSAEAFVERARFPSFFVAAGPPDPLPPPSAADEARAAREAARLDGLAQGREEGRTQALAEWAPRLAALAAGLEQTVATARAERERLAAELTDMLPRVVVQLTRKVIERELALGDDALRAAIETVARRLAMGGASGVRLAPDVAAALDAWRRAGGGAAALTDVTIHPDESLTRGDWIIETDGGFLDGRLATQLEEAWRLLTEPEA